MRDSGLPAVSLISQCGERYVSVRFFRRQRHQVLSVEKTQKEKTSRWD